MTDGLLTRCPWVGNDPLMTRYHDEEWGVPLHDDRKLFEFLVLDAFQAGLSWAIILRKREALRRVFGQFDPRVVARFTDAQQEILRHNPDIIRNRLKIRAAVTNARVFLQVQEECGSFDRYLWDFVDGKPVINHWQELSEIPTHSPESDALSRDLKTRGFKFVGTTICYAFMQAAGLVNDHLVSCFRYQEVMDPHS